MTDLPAMSELNSMMEQELAEAVERLRRVLEFVRSDGQAMTFQSLGKYRAEIVRLIEGSP